MVCDGTSLRVGNIECRRGISKGGGKFFGLPAILANRALRKTCFVAV